MIRSPNDKSQEIMAMKNSSLKPADMNSSSVQHTSASGKNKLSKKQGEKDDKNNKKKKKKRSSLAFWFCMGNKTSTIDKDLQPYPAHKSKKSKGKNDNLAKDASSKKKAKSGDTNGDKKINKKKSSPKDKNNPFEDRRRHRFSAPPTDWIAMAATLENQNRTASGSNSNPNLSEKGGGGGERSRSKSPGVRYRFDGTLEKPYVYPGGLTFQSMMKKQKKDKGRKSSKRSSKKGGNNGNDVEVEVHHTEDEMEDGDDFICYDSDDYDESDIRRHFYLRYDSHMRKKSSKKDRRYSMPADLNRPGPEEEMDPERLGSRYGRGETQWVDQRRVDVGHEEDYDEPYEESDDEKNVQHLMAHSRPSSYYNSPPVLQNSDCVYMWHSCEDISKCDHQYHSEEEVRNSMECLVPSQDSPNGNNVNSHHNDNNICNIYDKDDHIHVPTANPSPLSRDAINKNTNIDNVDKNVKVSHTLQESHVPSKPENFKHNNNDNNNDNNNVSNYHPSPSATQPENTPDFNENSVRNSRSNYLVHQSINSSHDLSDDVFNNSNENSPSRVQSTVNNITPKEKQTYVKNANKSSDNPFRRNLGRASCMPGNKRFFLPPPPCYTPPREEFQIARAKMSKGEKDEEEDEEENERDSRCSRGSQTDLTEECSDDSLDMAEREQRVSKHGSIAEQSDHIGAINRQPRPSSPGESLYESQAIKTNEQDPSNVVEVSTRCQGEVNRKTPSLRNDTNVITKNKDNDDKKTSTFDSYKDDDDEVLYQNCPKLKKPASSSTSTTLSQSQSSNEQSCSRGSSRRHTVMTSTPKAKRRLELSNTSTTNTPTTTVRTPKRPVPTPRQRFSSCLEYSSITFPSSTGGVSQQHQKQETGKEQNRQQNHHQQQQQQPEQHQQHFPHQKQHDNQQEQHAKKVLQNSTSLPAPMSSQPAVRPVAKKRLSQLLVSDSSYSHADIEEVLNFAAEQEYYPASKIANNKTVREELFSKNNDPKTKCVEDDEKTNKAPYSLSACNDKPSSILEVLEECSSKNGSTNDINRSNNINHDNTTCNNNRNDGDNCSVDDLLPPLVRYKLARSPTTSRRSLSGVFSSSVECLASPLAKSSYYYSGLSSSLVDIPQQLEHDPAQGRGMLMSSFPYNDDDDDDDENADDEMSVHNEESPLPKTPSLENLLRARSILDRSQAVCRKRRQRMRDRKCHSQILSSTEVDNYSRNHDDIRRRPSRHSSKNKHNTNANAPRVINSTTTTTHTRSSFSFDHDVNPTHSRRFLSRQNRLLNHTDSGMDSDGASPFNSRDFHAPSPTRESNAFPKQFNLITAEDGVSGGPRELGMTDNGKSLMGKGPFYDRHRLKKSRSKEFLAHSSSSHHLDKSVTVSNGFETLV